MFHYIMDTESWKDLSPGAMSAYFALKRQYNGANNGRIGFGSRGAAEALGTSKSSAARYLLELQEHGFIVKTKESSFNQKRLTIEWLLTEHRNDVTGELPLRSFREWSPFAGKNAVPPVKCSVPPAEPKKLIRHHISGNSPIGETAGAKSHEGQSHWRDTSTSEPGGQYVLNEAAKPKLVAAVRRAIETLDTSSLNSLRVTPVAESLADELIRSSEADLLSRCTKDIIPGSISVISFKEIQQYIETR